MIVYGIHNVIADKWYVGSTKNPTERYQTHLRNLRKNKHHSPKLQNAWNKYGSEAFQFFKLDSAEDEQELLFLEDLWTDIFDALDNGYVCIKANRASFSASTIELMRKNRQGENAHMFGKKHSKETRRKQSLSQLGSKNHRYGKSHTEAHKEHMSSVMKGRVSPLKGRKLNLSDEQREQRKLKMIEIWKERKATKKR